MLENQSVLIVKTLLLHVRQNIILRGYRDNGSLLGATDIPMKNDCNFGARKIEKHIFLHSKQKSSLSF